MGKIIHSIKENVFLKLYLVFISLINFAYVFLELLKSNYAREHSLEGIIEKDQFEYLSRISEITNVLEVVIIAMVLIYLLAAFIKKDIGYIKNFIFINFGILGLLFIVNYIISSVFLAPSGNANQQLIIPFSIAVLAAIYFGVSSFYKKRSRQ